MNNLAIELLKPYHTAVSQVSLAEIHSDEASAFLRNRAKHFAEVRRGITSPRNQLPLETQTVDGAFCRFLRERYTPACVLRYTHAARVTDADRAAYQRAEDDFIARVNEYARFDDGAVAEAKRLAFENGFYGLSDRFNKIALAQGV